MKLKLMIPTIVITIFLTSPSFAGWKKIKKAAKKAADDVARVADDAAKKAEAEAKRTPGNVEEIAKKVEAEAKRTPGNLEGVAKKIMEAFNNANDYNFDSIDGRAYRSGQMPPEKLREKIRAHNLKLVLNLRGEGHEGWEEEKRICEEEEVELVAVRLSANEIPSKESVAKIIKTLEDANQRGISFLIHCLAGADRTGAISTIYEMEYRGVSRRKARTKHLNVRYLHFAAQKMDEFVTGHYLGKDYYLNLN